MILKFFEIKKINFKKNNLFLFYGKNDGLKNSIIDELIKKNQEILTYDEKEILENKNKFLENCYTKSLFEEEKKIIIKRATDKILKIIEEIYSRNLNDTTIILNSDNLEKKSKLRSFFEKNKKVICIPFYPDKVETLLRLANNIARDKKIPISPENINIIVNKCNGDRENLINELKKIEYFSKNGKKPTLENISKLTNIIENYSISELIDNCLAKNRKKIVSILNENNYSNEDCIMITRTFLNKSKRILILAKSYEENKNIDLTISSAKPPIFWKEKEITKQQIYKWSSKNIKNLIYKLTELELLVKKNVNNSINLVSDFILREASSETNN